jgi:hypothetical protein
MYAKGAAEVGTEEGENVGEPGILHPVCSAFTMDPAGHVEQTVEATEEYDPGGHFSQY